MPWAPAAAFVFLSSFFRRPFAQNSIPDLSPLNLMFLVRTRRSEQCLAGVLASRTSIHALAAFRLLRRQLAFERFGAVSRGLT